MSHRDANAELDGNKMGNDTTAVDLQPDHDVMDNMIRGTSAITLIVIPPDTESAHSLPYPVPMFPIERFSIWANLLLLLPAEDSKNKLKNKKTMNNAKVAASVQVRRPDDLPLEGDGRKKSIVKADDDTIRSDPFDLVCALDLCR